MIFSKENEVFLPITVQLPNPTRQTIMSFKDTGEIIEESSSKEY